MKLSVDEKKKRNHLQKIRIKWKVEQIMAFQTMRNNLLVSEWEILTSVETDIFRKCTSLILHHCMCVEL